MSRELDDILGIAPTNIGNTTPNVTNVKQALTTIQQNYDLTFSDADPEFNEDFTEVRESLRNLISEISDNVSKLALIAQDTEKAAHFSALSQMMTVQLNANKQLLEIYSEKKKYFKPDVVNSKNDSSNINVQNAIFTGTTHDLKAWLKSQQVN